MPATKFPEAACCKTPVAAMLHSSTKVRQHRDGTLTDQCRHPCWLGSVLHDQKALWHTSGVRQPRAPSMAHRACSTSSSLLRSKRFGSADRPAVSCVVQHNSYMPACCTVCQGNRSAGKHIYSCLSDVDSVQRSCSSTSCTHPAIVARELAVQVRGREVIRQRTCTSSKRRVKDHSSLTQVARHCSVRGHRARMLLCAKRVHCSAGNGARLTKHLLPVRAVPGVELAAVVGLPPAGALTHCLAGAGRHLPRWLGRLLQVQESLSDEECCLAQCQNNGISLDI